MVLFTIDYVTRRVRIAGITTQAYGEWMEQIARNLTDPIGGSLRNKKYLVLDRDPLFTQDFKRILRTAGVKCIRTAVASPNMNPFAERFIRSIKSECLNRMLILGERHLV